MTSPSHFFFFFFLLKHIVRRAFISDDFILYCNSHSFSFCSADYFHCNFGVAPNSETCDIIQDTSDRMDWYVHNGETQSTNTGPLSGHTTGDLHDSYLYLEASHGLEDDKAM